MFHPTVSGTPQGGIVSPLLANIALDGIEELLSQFQKVKEYQYYDYYDNKRDRYKVNRQKSNRYGLIRYADDFMITATSKEDIETIKPIIEDWLKARGLELNPEKTKMVHVEQGFDFLGFQVRHHQAKGLITPAKQKVKDFLQRISDWLNTHPSHQPEAVIDHLNPILRGWANYYRHANSAQVFSSLDHYLWKAVFNWCRKRHPRKGKRWIVDKYFKTIQGAKWYFAVTVKNRSGKTATYALTKLANISIERHVKITGTASPDDPTLRAYK